VLCGLARGLDATGRLNPEGVEMALANIDRFTTLAHNMKVRSLDLLATAAVRDAADGEDFMRELERRPGIKAHIVSGKDEARFSGYGVICGNARRIGRDGRSGRRQPRAGGAGTGQARRLEHAAGRAAPPHVVRQERYPRKPCSMPSRACAGCARRPARPSTPWAAPGVPLPRLHMEQAGYPLHIIHHYEIAAEEARAVARLIAVQSAKSLEKMPGVSRRRVDTLPLACWRSTGCWRRSSPRPWCFSAFGLREGFYYSG